MLETFKKLSESSGDISSYLKPVSDFFEYFYKVKGFSNTNSAEEYLKSYILKYEKEIKDLLEKEEKLNFYDFSEVASLPLKNICIELGYEKKEEFITAYKTLIIVSILYFKIESLEDFEGLRLDSLN